jgi:glycerol-3-phosphate acyltransferase PlsX
LTTDGAISVALDAMGGDHAPAEIVRGSLTALERFPKLSILLVGDQGRINAELTAQGAANDRIGIRQASQIVGMGESPVDALRRKHDTSIQRCMEALRSREVEAVVSAGDTGGVVAAATLFARRLKGVKRHGIAIPVPTNTGRALLMDVGANIHCKPAHLLQYGIMASAYAKAVMGIENPRVGLLSVGEEEAKGNDLVKRTRNLLSRSGMNFVGNVEGQAIFTGIADVIVCDGFVGNVILKVAEGLAETFIHTVLSAAQSAESLSAQSREWMGALRERLDYSATGGAPLLGVEGSVIICHGRSKAKAIANAIGVAVNFTRTRINDQIVAGVAEASALLPADHDRGE